MKEVKVHQIYKELSGKKRFLLVTRIIGGRNIVCKIGRRARKKIVWVPRRTVLLDTVLLGDGFRLEKDTDDIH